MNIKIKKSGGLTIIFDKGEAQLFLSNCYKSYQKDSCLYFTGLFEEIVEKQISLPLTGPKD